MTVLGVARSNLVVRIETVLDKWGADSSTETQFFNFPI